MKNIWRGMILGLGGILPGVSGGTLAISMGIYDKLLYYAGNFFANIKESIRFLLPLGIGMVISMVGSVFGLEYLFARFELQANLLFIGLILGSFPAIYGRVSKVKLRVSHVICALALFAMVTGLSMVHDVLGRDVVLEVGLLPAVKLFLVGILAAATMVIPGVSGSMILLLMGYYKPLLTNIEAAVKAVLNFQIAEVFELGILLAPFAIGMVVGVVLVAKITLWLFEKFEAHVYFAIIGLLLASPIGILMTVDYTGISLSGILVGIVLLVVGLVASRKLGE